MNKQDQNTEAKNTSTKKITRRSWTSQDDQALIRLNKERRPQRFVAEYLDRTIAACNTRLSQLRKGENFDEIVLHARQDSRDIEDNALTLAQLYVARSAIEDSIKKLEDR